MFVILCLCVMAIFFLGGGDPCIFPISYSLSLFTSLFLEVTSDKVIIALKLSVSFSLRFFQIHISGILIDSFLYTYKSCKLWCRAWVSGGGDSANRYTQKGEKRITCWSFINFTLGQKSLVAAPSPLEGEYLYRYIHFWGKVKGGCVPPRPPLDSPLLVSFYI